MADTLVAILVNQNALAGDHPGQVDWCLHLGHDHLGGCRVRPGEEQVHLARGTQVQRDGAHLYLSPLPRLVSSRLVWSGPAVPS